jgi:hypothetical protein
MKDQALPSGPKVASPCHQTTQSSALNGVMEEIKVKNKIQTQCSSNKMMPQ